MYCFVFFNILADSQYTKCEGCLFFSLFFVGICHSTHKNDTSSQFRNDKNQITGFWGVEFSNLSMSIVKKLATCL